MSSSCPRWSRVGGTCVEPFEGSKTLQLLEYQSGASVDGGAEKRKDSDHREGGFPEPKMEVRRFSGLNRLALSYYL